MRSFQLEERSARRDPTVASIIWAVLASTAITAFASGWYVACALIVALAIPRILLFFFKLPRLGTVAGVSYIASVAVGICVLGVKVFSF